MSSLNPSDPLARDMRSLAENMRWPTRSKGFDGAIPAFWPDVATAIGRASVINDGGAYVRVIADSAGSQPQPSGGRLAGLPIAVKDLVAVAGQPIGAGSAVRDSASIELEHSSIVAQFLSLGAVVVGLTALHEFAFGVTGVNDHSGYPRNPHDPDRIPGGSSSGSAVAVAQGSAAIGIGTDTGGSIRLPASLCGVVGFKPSFGTYPLKGILPLAPSLDHVGLIAASVDMIRTVHTGLGHSADSGVQLRCIGVAESEVEDADPAVAFRIEDAIRRVRLNGIETVAVKYPDSERTLTTSTTIMFSEASAIHHESLSRTPKLYGADVRRRLEAGYMIDGPTYVAAKEDQRCMRTEVWRTLEGVDAVLSPTVPTVAPSVDSVSDPNVSARLVRNTRLANVVGLPTISIPLPGDGLPIGLQVMASTNSALLPVAAEIERILRP